MPRPARDAILAWYAERGRPLAFRATTDPYAVLVSEAMAQQTQAARAAAYWERWMVRFPTVGALAEATPADVLREWAGLGYDRRAMNLWRAARLMVERHEGRVPSDLDALRALPGVGPYTARAVAAIAFGQPVGAVDVNVGRVLGRIVGGSSDSLSARELQAVADDAVPSDRPGSWTHAVMDLGATVCRPHAPRCEACPVQAWCAYASGSPRISRAGARARAAETPAPFHTTRRWLRGRILDRLRAASDGAWTTFDDQPLGGHGPSDVRVALEALARDGLIELDGVEPDMVKARLALG